MLTDLQRAWVAERFAFFDEERCAGLFHDDQPTDSMARYKGTDYPSVLMVNGVKWLLRGDARPVRDGLPIKTLAPKGVRPLLYDTIEPEELVLVEGEGHLIACVSVGLDGVVTAGGVGAFKSQKPEAMKVRDAVRGKSVRVLFDPDEHGRKNAPQVARAMLHSGAIRVACVFPPGEDDVEDWLGTFQTSTQALAALHTLLGSVDWATPEELKETKPVALQVARIRHEGDDVPTLAVMVYDDSVRKASVAVFGPKEEEQHAAAKAGYPAPVKRSAERVWQLHDEWTHGGVTYVPDMNEETQKALDEDMLVLPPPPIEKIETSEGLWDDLKQFYQTWFAVEPIYYDVLAAYCFLTYRLNDARFMNVGYLRFVGESTTGKGRALDVMRYTCWRSYKARPGSGNLHRVVDYYGEFSLAIDEFHPEQVSSSQQVKELIDVLNMGFNRSSPVVKMDKQRDGRMTPHLYTVFGPKFFGSYHADEDAAFARRCIVVPTGRVVVPEAMKSGQFPPAAISTARELRARLLSWRGRKLVLGLPDPQGPMYRRVVEIGGLETADTFWPLAEMVPGSRPKALANLLEIARGRRVATRESRHTTQEAYLLDIFASLWLSRRFVKIEGGWFIPTADISDAADRENVTPTAVSRTLKRIGFDHGARRFTRTEDAAVEQRKGFIVRDPKDAWLYETFARHGIEWPGPLAGSEPEPQEVGV